MTVNVGEAEQASSGLAVTFRGASHDSFDDGRTDLVLSLSLQHGEAISPWMPSAFAPPTAVHFAELAHCVRIAEGSEHLVVVESAPDAP